MMINFARKLLAPLLPPPVRVFLWKLALQVGYDGRGFLLEMLPAGSAGAEIGVWKGDFSAKVLAAVKPKALHLVDPWKFNTDYPGRAYGGGIARNQGDMDAIHQGVVERFADHPEVRVHRSPSQLAAADFEDGELDWVYIDGDHSEEAVYQDLASYFPKVRVGGYIAGDDYEWTNEAGEKAVVNAVERFSKRFAVETKVIKNSQFVLVKLAE